MSLSDDIYRSLLETMSINPKKKHFKKICEYVRKHEKIEDVKPVLLDHIINVGIRHGYPITLGQFVRDLII